MSLPYQTTRNELYTPKELLLEVVGEDQTLDSRIALHFASTKGDRADDFVELRNRNEHDSHLLRAARAYIDGKRVVAFMGGHALKRDSKGYASCARIARALSRAGFFIMTGGGPGAMEAAMLGVYLAAEEDGALDVALVELSKSPSHLEKDSLACAIRVQKIYPRSEESKRRYPSLGVPTWLYSSEPSNIFSTRIAKLFNNGVREDFLTNEAREAIVFLPGSLGTLQEMFMMTALIHYKFSPATLYFLDSERYWEEKIPVLPLLRQLSTNGGWKDKVVIQSNEYALVKNIVETPQRSTL